MMDEKNLHIEGLLAEYFSRRLSPDELSELRAWVGASAENERQFVELREVWISSAGASDRQPFDKEAAYRRFLLRTGSRERVAHRKLSWRPAWQAAAVVALVVATSYVSFWQGGKPGRQLAAISVEAPVGSRVKTSLPDGTVVWLNAESKLTYAQGFGVSERTVCLSGEGYFEVVRNEKLPFSVQTDELHVDVLGTKFNLRNYADDTEAMVCLLEGSVLFDNHVQQEKDVLMEPNQKVFLDKKSGDVRLAKVAAGSAMEWTNGYLFFDEEVLSDIAKVLERSYNVSISVHPEVANLRFYGNFVQKEATIKEVLDMLASTNKLTYSIVGREVEIREKDKIEK